MLYPLLDMAFLFFYRGALALSLPRLTMTTANGDGVSNAIVGTLLITGMAGLVAVPIGVIGGIFLAEFSGKSRYAEAVRFMADVLAGVPSIMLGYLSLVVLVLYLGWGHGSGGSLLAGALALSVLMLPYILRTTELSIRKVPNTLREAATALGATKTQMVNRMTFLLALPGILTGVILSASIAIGEAVPLLILAGNSDYYSFCLTNCPTSYLTYLVWNFVKSPNTLGGEPLAYLSVFLLMSIVIGLNVIARIGLRRFSRI
jgi:phosphate transport system permease protein